MNTIQLYFALLFGGSISAVFLAVRQHKRKMDLLRQIVATAKNIKTTAAELEKRLETTTKFRQSISISSYEYSGAEISPFGIEPLKSSGPYFQIITSPTIVRTEVSDKAPLTYNWPRASKAKEEHSRKTAGQQIPRVCY